MSEVSSEETVSAVDLARQNLDLARRLDAVHPLGQTILSAFEQDVLLAELDEEGSDELVRTPSATSIDELLASDDIELLESELEQRANHSLSIIGDLGDKDPGAYDRNHRHEIVAGNKGDLSRTLNGSVLAVRRNFGGEEIPARIVLVGGLLERFGERTAKKLPPNPSVHILNLRPFKHSDGVWSWGNGLGYNDMDQLGQTSNCYFNEATYRGTFMNAYGHARAYRVDYGKPTFEMPVSQNPADIVLEKPMTEIDHLVKNATEAIRIEERIREIKFPRPQSVAS